MSERDETFNAYVPNAVPEGDGSANLLPLGAAGEAVHLKMHPKGAKKDVAATTVTLFDQGLTQVLQAAVTGLEAKKPYLLALSDNRNGTGPLQGLSKFMTNPAGSDIVNAVGPIRQIVEAKHKSERRYIVITTADEGRPQNVVQVQGD